MDPTTESHVRFNLGGVTAIPDSAAAVASARNVSFASGGNHFGRSTPMEGRGLFSSDTSSLVRSHLSLQMASSGTGRTPVRRIGASVFEGQGFQFVRCPQGPQPHLREQYDGLVDLPTRNQSPLDSNDDNEESGDESFSPMHPIATITHRGLDNSFFGVSARPNQRSTELRSSSNVVLSAAPRRGSDSSTSSSSMPPLLQVPRPFASTVAAGSASISVHTLGGPASRTRKREAAAFKASPPEDDDAKLAPPPLKRSKQPPAGLKRDPDEDVAEESSSGGGKDCCICMCEFSAEEAASINGCDHLFCFDCIEKWADRENTCPLCKERFSKIDRVQKTKRERGVEATKNSKKVRNRDQRADMPGHPLESILASLADPNAPNFAHLILSGSTGMFGASDVPRRPHRDLMSRTRVATRRHPLADSDEDNDRTRSDSDSFSFLSRIHGGAPVLGAFRGDVVEMHISSSNGTHRRYNTRLAASSGGVSPELHVTQRHVDSLHQQLSPPARNFATNAHEANAGGSRDNPLEICVDDDSDDEVEVVQVTAPRQRMV